MERSALTLPAALFAAVAGPATAAIALGGFVMDGRFFEQAGGAGFCLDGHCVIAVALGFQPHQMAGLGGGVAGSGCGVNAHRC